MSVVIETLVFCDGCNENYSGDDRNEPAWMIRKGRKKDGWTRRGSKDYCEECTKKKVWEEKSKPILDCLEEHEKETLSNVPSR